VRIFLAAIETAPEHSVAAVKARVPWVLSSYFYARKPSSPLWWDRAMRQAELRLADSGAFTIRTATITKGSKDGRDTEGVDYDKYLSEYIEWLKVQKRAGLADYWVEMDIAVAVGYPWVEKQRLAYERAGLSEGLVNVWHSDKDWDYWLYLLDEARRPGRSRYVAIESHQRDRRPLEYAKFLRAAYDRGVRVHGFKMTASDDMHLYPFFSVDSSSWIAPMLYGMNFMRRSDGTLQGIARNAQKKLSPSQLIIPPAVLDKCRGGTMPDRIDALKYSAEAWVRFGQDMLRMWRGRGVDWDKAVEVNGR